MNFTVIYLHKKGYVVTERHDLESKAYAEARKHKGVIEDAAGNLLGDYSEEN